MVPNIHCHSFVFKDRESTFPHCPHSVSSVLVHVDVPGQTDGRGSCDVSQLLARDVTPSIFITPPLSAVIVMAGFLRPREKSWRVGSDHHSPPRPPGLTAASLRSERWRLKAEERSRLW